MKEYVGLAALVAVRDHLPDVGWIFVERGFERTSPDASLGAKFFVQETDDDEEFGEKNLSAWLESPTFEWILKNREKNIKSPSTLQYAEAVVYYLERDDFLG